MARPALWGARSPMARYLDSSLEIEAAHLAPGQPVVVLVHGWNFDPTQSVVAPPHSDDAGNGHARLYHFHRYTDNGETEIRHHSSSWPLGLRIAEGDGGTSGLAVAFAWHSKPGWFESLTDHGLNPYARAYQAAETYAWDLAGVLEMLAQRLPGHPIDIFCHSLGSRVVVRALAQAADRGAPGDGDERMGAMLARLGRVVLLAGAERVLEAQLMMARLNATRDGRLVATDRDNAVHPQIPEFYNFVSRENDVLDKLGENFGPSAPGSKQVIGHNGLERMDRAWLDVQLDDPETAAWFSAHPQGYAVSDDNTGVFAVLDHWIHFTWRENMRLYADILRTRDPWRVSAIKLAAPDLFDRPRITRRRWSTL